MNEKYVLKLYVVGGTPRSEEIIAAIRKICDSELESQYRLEVIDVMEQPALAEDERIVATPTLVKALPEPLRRVIVDLSNQENILLGLDLRGPDGKPNIAIR